MTELPLNRRPDRIAVSGTISRYLDVNTRAADLLAVGPAVLEFVSDRNVVVITPHNLLELRRVRRALPVWRGRGRLDVSFLDERGVRERIQFRPANSRRLDRALRRSGWDAYRTRESDGRRRRW